MTDECKMGEEGDNGSGVTFSPSIWKQIEGKMEKDRRVWSHRGLKTGGGRRVGGWQWDEKVGWVWLKPGIEGIPSGALHSFPHKRSRGMIGPLSLYTLILTHTHTTQASASKQSCQEICHKAILSCVNRLFWLMNTYGTVHNHSVSCHPLCSRIHPPWKMQSKELRGTIENHLLGNRFGSQDVLVAWTWSHAHSAWIILEM